MNASWTPAERAILLEVARAAVRAAAEGARPPPVPGDLPPALTASAGVFVTLHVGPELRGCIGDVAGTAPIADVTARMARAAATRDPRFSPLQPHEIADLHIEISILSAMRPVTPPEIDPRIHGVSLRCGARHAILLPQVAAREGWDTPTLLGHLCDKAGLPPDGWRDTGTVLFAFTVETVEDDG